MTDTASSAVDARSRARRRRSMPRSAFSPWGPRVNTASLPITTPCSLAPTSAPHIHQGREMRRAWVRSTWGMSIQVQATRSPGRWSSAGTHSSGWASLGSRSLFLAKSTPSSVRVTIESHIGLPGDPFGLERSIVAPARPGERRLTPYARQVHGGRSGIGLHDDRSAGRLIDLHGAVCSKHVRADETVVELIGL